MFVRTMVHGVIDSPCDDGVGLWQINAMDGALSFIAHEDAICEHFVDQIPSTSTSVCSLRVLNSACRLSQYGKRRSCPSSVIRSPKMRSKPINRSRHRRRTTSSTKRRRTNPRRRRRKRPYIVRNVHDRVVRVVQRLALPAWDCPNNNSRSLVLSCCTVSR